MSRRPAGKTGGKKLVIVATGDRRKPPVNIAYVKTHLDAAPSLRGRLAASLLFPEVHGSFRGVASRLKGMDPDIVMFHSHIEWNSPECLRTCAALKRWKPGLVILMSAEPVNKVSPGDAGRNGVDFLIRGEPELPAEKILLGLLDRGGARRRRAKAAVVEAVKVPRDPDRLPSPYLEGCFDMRSCRSAQVILARGCGNSCLYCAINQSPQRYHSFARIKAELDHVLREAPALENLLLTASDFYDNAALAAKVLAYIRPRAEKRGISVRVCTNGGRDIPHGLLRLTDSPCMELRVGVQSLDDGVLRAIRRPARSAELKRNILTIKARAPRAAVALELIRGLPGDTEDSYLDTLEWCVSTGLEVCVNHLFAVSGTELDRVYRRRGLRLGRACPYYAEESDSLSRSRLAALTRRTRLIFMALDAARSSPALAADFFRTARGLGRPRPHLFLAEALAGRLLSSPLTARACGDYLRAHPGRDNTLSGGFSRRNALEFYSVFGELKASPILI